ncbi:hypothetical protein [Sphingomonas sp. LHG3443-2]|uniref:hypothetical protein n=1 Tax=Sphingomonas sp. LHG3443-2 TaxID=2804639 RepID=UPI003CF8FAA5
MSRRTNCTVRYRGPWREPRWWNGFERRFAIVTFGGIGLTATAVAGRALHTGAIPALRRPPTDEIVAASDSPVSFGLWLFAWCLVAIFCFGAAWLMWWARKDEPRYHRLPQKYVPEPHRVAPQQKGPGIAAEPSCSVINPDGDQAACGRKP